MEFPGCQAKIKPVELTKSMKKKIKANLELLNKVGKLLRRDGEYGEIIASKEHIYADRMNIQALLNDFGSVILTKVIAENKGILKKIRETSMNVRDIVLYAPV